MTLPLLLALKRCTAAEREEVAALLKTAGRRAATLAAEGSSTRRRCSPTRISRRSLELVRALPRRRGHRRGAPRSTSRARARRDRPLPRRRREARAPRGGRVRGEPRATSCSPLAPLVPGRDPMQSQLAPPPGDRRRVDRVPRPVAPAALASGLARRPRPRSTRRREREHGHASRSSCCSRASASRSARAILDYREGEGRASRASRQLREVKGIGDAALERLRPHLALEGKTTLERRPAASRSGGAARAPGTSPPGLPSARHAPCPAACRRHRAAASRRRGAAPCGASRTPPRSASFR